MSTDVLTITAALIAVLSTLIGSLAQLLGKESRDMHEEQEVDKPRESLDEKRLRHLRKRMDEVERGIEHYKSEASLNRWSNNLLIGGQYVIGGLLASSFIQQSLPPNLVGVMGLVVLGATIVHQRYRPDVKYRIAREKISLLRSTLRRIQDELAASSDPDTTKMTSKLSQVLSRVDDDTKWGFEDEDSKSTREGTEKPSTPTPTKPETQSLKIEKAQYGAGNNFFDVTNELISQIRNDQLEILVDDQIKGDPVRGVTKALTVTYWHNMERYTKTVKQGDILVLP